MESNKKISIGGMIGSGKSECSKFLSKKHDFQLIKEFEEDDELFKMLLSEFYSGNEHSNHPLQSYFLHNSFIRSCNNGFSVITDRDLAEHWIFANANIKVLEQKAAYNGSFWNYYAKHWHPDLYLILDCSWTTIRERILKRGREQELINFKKNEKYFEELNKNYTKKLKGFCDLNDIKCIVIDANEDKFYEKINIIIWKY